MRLHSRRRGLVPRTYAALVLSSVDAVTAVSRPPREAEPSVCGVCVPLQLPKISVVKTQFGGDRVPEGGRGAEKLLLHLLQLERDTKQRQIREKNPVYLHNTGFNDALLPPSECTTE